MDMYGPQMLLAHSGTGGMTSSLSIGSAGSAAARRMALFPLSPEIVTGRSQLPKTTEVLDPRYDNERVTRDEIVGMVHQQWPSRSRPVNSRAQIEAALQEFSQ